jgi:hypothetical protein
VQRIDFPIELRGALPGPEVLDVLPVADREVRFAERARASKQRDQRLMQVVRS